MSHPAKVILFGSYARGTADEGSDLDLLVVEKEVPDKAGEYLRLKAAVGRVGVGVDLLLMSESEFEVAGRCRAPYPIGPAKRGECCMTPQHEEAGRLLRLATRDQTAFKAHDLEELAARLRTAGVLLPVTEEQLSRLTPYAV
jgi:predicted nucleotidyltransferase